MKLKRQKIKEKFAAKTKNHQNNNKIPPFEVT
jgi:hypothetical protein